MDDQPRETKDAYGCGGPVLELGAVMTDGTAHPDGATPSVTWRHARNRRAVRL